MQGQMPSCVWWTPWEVQGSRGGIPMIFGPCKHNVICCDALQSAAVLTLQQGEQAGCIKSRERDVVLWKHTCLVTWWHTDVVVANSEASFEGFVCFHIDTQTSLSVALSLDELITNFHALRKPLLYMNNVLHQMLAHQHHCALHHFPAWCSTKLNATNPCTDYWHDCISTANTPCTYYLQCKDLGELLIYCLRHFRALYNESPITRYMLVMSGTTDCVALYTVSAITRHSCVNWSLGTLWFDCVLRGAITIPNTRLATIVQTTQVQDCTLYTVSDLKCAHFNSETV